MTSPAAYARALHEAWQETPVADQAGLLDRFAAQLQAEGAMDLTPNILGELERLEADAAADAAVTVISARPLPSSTLATILGAVRPMVPSTATPQTQVDPTLVGGFIVRTPTLEIDAGVHRVLNRLVENTDYSPSS